MNSRWILSCGVMSLVLLSSYGVASLLSQEARPSTPSSRLGMKLNNGQMDLTVQSPLQMTLRSSDGKMTKGIDAQENGATVVTSYHKDGSRFYSIEDTFDGSAQMIIMGTDKERVSLQINKDGSIDVKVLTDTPTTLAKPVLPEPSPNEPVSAPKPIEDESAAEADPNSGDGTGANSILSKRKEDK